MIVEQVGYLKLKQVTDLLKSGKSFSIYKTNKGTEILVEKSLSDTIHLYYPKEDRLPYKIIEGKKICHGKKIFDSSYNIDELNILDWNNGNQIMSYKEYV